MKTKEFREALKKIMPGYRWTVHTNRYIAPRMLLRATGIQSSGSKMIYDAPTLDATQLGIGLLMKMVRHMLAGMTMLRAKGWDI